MASFISGSFHPVTKRYFALENLNSPMTKTGMLSEIFFMVVYRHRFDSRFIEKEIVNVHS